VHRLSKGEYLVLARPPASRPTASLTYRARHPDTRHRHARSRPGSTRHDDLSVLPAGPSTRARPAHHICGQQRRTGRCMAPPQPLNAPSIAAPPSILTTNVACVAQAATSSTLSAPAKSPRRRCPLPNLPRVRSLESSTTAPVQPATPTRGRRPKPFTAADIGALPLGTECLRSKRRFTAFLQRVPERAC
jgi:hypothetical protein